jgi:2-iminobutanoate/2-iminopropanoate deaminase
MTDTVLAWTPTVIAPPIGKYSHLVAVDPAASWVFISGQVGADRDGLIPPDPYEQARNIFANIEQLLGEVGAEPRHIVRLLTFAVSTDDLPAFARARDEVFARWYPDDRYCGHSLAVVAALAAPGLRFEIEGWLALPGSARVR